MQTLSVDVEIIWCKGIENCAKAPIVLHFFSVGSVRTKPFSYLIYTQIVKENVDMFFALADNGENDR